MYLLQGGKDQNEQLAILVFSYQRNVDNKGVMLFIIWNFFLLYAYMHEYGLLVRV